MSVPDSVEAILRKVQLFAALTADEMHSLAARTGRKHLGRGELLFSEGDPCAGLFLVASGRIRIFKLSPTGREQALAMEGPGGSFAELPVFDGGTYPASASAAEDTDVLFISRKDFQNFCRQHPDVALKVIAVVGSRLRRLIGIIEELSFSTVRHRLASLLLRLAREGERTPSGVMVTLPASQQEVAAEIGTVRELVSRNLGRLQAEEIIQVDGRKILILNMKALEAELEEAL